VSETLEPAMRSDHEAGEEAPRSTLPLEEDPAWRAYVADLRERAEAGVEAAVASLADLPRRARMLAEIWELTRRDR
jgi:hypothetical protein